MRGHHRSASYLKRVKEGLSSFGYLERRPGCLIVEAQPSSAARTSSARRGPPISLKSRCASRGRRSQPGGVPIESRELRAFIGPGTLARISHRALGRLRHLGAGIAAAHRENFPFGCAQCVQRAATRQMSRLCPEECIFVLFSRRNATRCEGSSASRCSMPSSPRAGEKCNLRDTTDSIAGSRGAPGLDSRIPRSSPPSGSSAIVPS